MIDIPTRGYPDNYTQIGILLDTKKSTSNPNNIVRLFGRQTYPGSNKYEYYITVSSGQDIIKIPLETKRLELYDDDEIYIQELNSTYRVKLYDYDAPRYYPDVL